jgi:hypothetical protein
MYKTFASSVAGFCLSAFLVSSAAADETPKFISTAGWSLDPDISIDMEGFFSPQTSTPYVTISPHNADDFPMALPWQNIRTMIQSGDYGNFEPQLIIEACQLMKQQAPGLHRDKDFLNIDAKDLPETTFPCAAPLVS